MSQRTTTSAVQTLLASNYDCEAAPSLQPYIDTASVVVDRVATCATNRGVTLTATELELIERWLAAHYYTKMDPLYKSRSTLSASGVFVDRSYLDGALDADSSGCLKSIIERKIGGLTSLSKPYHQATSWEDRNY